MKQKPEAILEALQAINSNHGRGEVVSVQIGLSTYTQKPFQCRERTRKFKVVRETEASITVSACGHERTIQLDPIADAAKRFEADFYKLFVSLKKTIDDAKRATNDPDDDKPGMQVTVSTDDDCSGWNYQTGDNSYTGGCYGHPHWAVVYLYRNSNCREVASDAVNQLLEALPVS